MAELKINGIILSQMDLGEHDRIYTILSAQLGRIRAVAKGVKRKKSVLATCGLFLYGEFILFEGRELYYINSVSAISDFFELSQDVESFALACYFSKLAQNVSAEKVADQALLKLLLNMYYLLENRKFPLYILKSVYELKLCQLAGFMPNTSNCVSCGKKDSEWKGEFFYSAAAGGLLCNQCRVHYADDRELSKPVLQALRYILNSPLREACSFHLSSDFQNNLTAVAEEHANYHIPGGISALNYYKGCKLNEIPSCKMVMEDDSVKTKKESE